MLQKLEELGKTGWSFSFDLCFSQELGQITVLDADAFIGDSNCPYPKEWDPKDGHGYSWVNLDDIEEDLPYDRMIDILYDRCKEKEKQFGKER